MTPKEKAKELANKFYETCNCTIAGTSTIFRQIGVQAALIAVEEIIEIVGSDETAIIVELPFWQEVKQELLKQQSNVT
ncbi:MAG: hypothetical protein B7Y11_13705 [Sphingobacteriia bacterium 24-36-13]|nr:MAG: hypothetical protein B7Y11_13705 [Sphingobacteriia bacterium 24-36-13]